MTERLDAFMARANAAYYAGHDPFADFTTAPEIAQAFGEVLGAWAAQGWAQMGRPDPVILAEAGPGRGTLMTDALRLVRAVAPGFAAALRLWLIETSPRLREVQAAALPGARFAAELSELPPGPLLWLGNEFLDALPIRQFRRGAAGWTERHVGPAGAVDLPCPPPPEAVGAVAGPGEVVEYNAAAEMLVTHLATRLRESGGAALFLDYGPSRRLAGESLQALRGGRAADPYAAPGTADLTAHVDFASLAAAARRCGAAVFGPLPQGVFLTRIGLFARTDALARRAGPRDAAALIEAARRLVEPDRMGGLFKAFCLAAPGFGTPAGFEPEPAP
jgi:SAM-dependent MidA family methyltransferase